jgi:transcriptional regulator with XRE-family HTH domain
MGAHTMHRASTQTQLLRFARRWSAADASAVVYQRAGAGKHLARAHGVHASTISRYQQGAQYSPFCKAVELLANSPYTDSFCALTEAWVVVSIEEVRKEETDILLTQRDGFEDALDELTLAIKRHRARGESTRHLVARRADVSLKLTAIQTVLEEREHA